MLEVQKYLTTPGKSFDTLTSEYGIKVSFKDHLVKLSYSQIDSPKMHPITMECRGLVLNRFTYGVVGACFKRFFNYGEALEITSKFDWSDFAVYTKEDGSWISLFFDIFDGKWKVTTRNSFADAEMFTGGPVWEELVFELLDGKEKYLSPNHTYIFELCTLYNKVVREYREPKLVLLGVIDNGVYDEVSDYMVDTIATRNNFHRPQRFEFRSVTEVQEYLRENSLTDATFEGVVMKDRNGLRIKLKSLTYCSLHMLKGEGKNMYLPKYILPFVLACEGSELLAYFPEVKPNYTKVKTIVEECLISLRSVWDAVKGIEGQKEFAAALSAHRHPFSQILFNARKNGTDDIESEFRSATPEIGEDKKNVHKAMLFNKIVDHINKQMGVICP